MILNELKKTLRKLKELLNNRRTLCFYIVIISGVLTLVGWKYNITMFKSMLPNKVSMKPSTAVCFILSGVIGVCTMSRNHKYKSLEIASATTALMFGVAMMIVAQLFNYDQFVLKIGVDQGIQTVGDHIPSIGTVLGFCIVAIMGASSLLNIRHQKGQILLIYTGLIALIGYLLNFPVLYYYFPEVSTAMALHTAVCFVLLGLGFEDD